MVKQSMPNFTTWSYTAPTVEEAEVDRERAALSEEEERRVQDDLYGKYEPGEETTQIIADKIEEMRRHIDEIPDDEKESYLDAQEECPEYCNSVLFQIMFLRADKLDAEKAAIRFVAYWEEKLDLFGPERTYHRLSIDDLMADPEDADLLKSGAFYPLPQKDGGGRAILFLNRSKLALVNRDSKLRVLWYMLHCMFEDDVTTQKKGFVLVVSPPEKQTVMQAFDRKFMKRALHFDKVHFGRIAAYHTVMPAASFVSIIVLPVLYYLLGPEKRLRFVSHSFQQTPREAGQKLKAYGIKIGSLPLELGGPVQFKYDSWLDQRRAIEEAR